MGLQTVPRVPRSCEDSASPSSPRQAAQGVESAACPAESLCGQGTLDQSLTHHQHPCSPATARSGTIALHHNSFLCQGCNSFLS